MIEPYTQERWGIDPARRNDPRTKMIIRVARWRARNPRAPRVARKIQVALCRLLGSDIRCTRFGVDLYLPHPFSVVIHDGATLGDRCTVYQCVTIGEDNRRPGVPVIGNDVVIGAGAAVLGPILVGDGARIGANAVVLSDVPAGATAVGAPARIIHHP